MYRNKKWEILLKSDAESIESGANRSYVPSCRYRSSNRNLSIFIPAQKQTLHFKLLEHLIVHMKLLGCEKATLKLQLQIASTVVEEKKGDDAAYFRSGDSAQFFHS